MTGCSEGVLIVVGCTEGSRGRVVRCGGRRQ